MVIGQMIVAFMFVIYAGIAMALLFLPVFAFVILVMGLFFGAVSLIVRLFT